MKPTVTVFVERHMRGVYVATAGASHAQAAGPLLAARACAAHYLAVPEARVSVEITAVADASCVVQAKLKPARNPIAWELLRWAVGFTLVALVCWAIWEGHLS